jgi:hypothetical protein
MQELTQKTLVLHNYLIHIDVILHVMDVPNI